MPGAPTQCGKSSMQYGNRMESTVLMRGALLLLILFTLTLTAANLKLYTTDGEHQIVREYLVVGDRVRFYSVDRSDWEEVPASLIDLPEFYFQLDKEESFGIVKRGPKKNVRVVEQVVTMLILNEYIETRDLVQT